MRNLDWKGQHRACGRNKKKRRPQWFDSPFMLWRPESCVGLLEPRTLLTPPSHHHPHLSTQQLHTLSEYVITKRWKIKCTFRRSSPNRSPVCTTATAPVLSSIKPDFHLSLPFSSRAPNTRKTVSHPASQTLWKPSGVSHNYWTRPRWLLSSSSPPGIF